MPERSLDAQAEALRARKEPVLVERSERRILAVGGPDRIEFTHALSSNDVRGLAVGAGHHTTFLTGKGKMRGDAVLYRLAEEVLLIAEAAATEGIRVHLESFHILEEVAIEDRAKTHVVFEVHGPGAREALSTALALAIPADLAAHAVLAAEHAGARLLIAAEPWTGEEGYAIVAPAAVAVALFAALSPSFAPVGEDAIEILRIEQGIPRYGVDMDEGTIPIEAGLAHAVSYTKGCYTGNEVILRIKTYGHVNRILAHLSLAGGEPPRRGATVRADGKDVGVISSATFSPHLGRAVALAMLRRESAHEGNQVMIDGPSPMAAEVVVHPVRRPH